MDGRDFVIGERDKVICKGCGRNMRGEDGVRVAVKKFISNPEQLAWIPVGIKDLVGEMRLFSLPV